MAERHQVASFDVPIARDVDVLVVGGGPAGIAAAIGAAQSGMRVLLTEHYGFLGGAHASGEIGTFCGLYATTSEEHVATFIGRGINRALLNALHGVTTGARPQAAITGPQRWFNTYIEIYDPFWLRLCLDRLVKQAGVEVLLHATALEPITNGAQVEGALFSTKSGIVAVKSRVLIDASGDADMVARAGGAFRMGEDGKLMHPSMMFRMFGVDTERLRYVSWTQIGAIMQERGPAYGLNRFYPGVFLGTREGEVLLNVTKLTRADGSDLDPLNLWDLSWAEMQGREACALYEQFFREQMPGFEKARINATAAAIAVRETRLIEGEYRLTSEDVLAGHKFDDGIAYSAWPMEKIDPSSRLRLDTRAYYGAATLPGAVVQGRVLGVVEQSRNLQFQVGDLVQGSLGWQTYAISDGTGLVRLPNEPATPLTAYIGLLGHIGLTAYVGLIDIGQPEAGETLVVSAAAGAVGSVVGQIGKIKGCRVVGIAGSADKCRWLTDSLGFDAAINYKSEPLSEQLAQHCPAGVEQQININARIVLCGLISQYNATESVPGPYNFGNILTKRARVEGFLNFDHLDRMDACLADLSNWLQQGKLQYQVDITAGLEQAPAVFSRLFSGSHMGKLIVQVSDEPPQGDASSTAR